MRRSRECLLGVALVLVAAPSGALGADEKAACIQAADRGQVLRDKHQLLAAREQFIACGRDACPAAVRKQCAEWLGEIETALPSVVLEATSGASEVTDVRVSVDGAPLVDRIGADAIPIDPGTHTFRFERAGSAPVVRDVVVREGEKFQKVAISFETLATATPASPLAASSTSTATAPGATSTAAPPAAPTPPDLVAPSEPPPSKIELSFELGTSLPIGFVDAGALGPLLSGNLEVAWRLATALDLGVFGDLAGGGLTLQDAAASAAYVQPQAGYGRGMVGVRGRWHFARARRWDVYLGTELEVMGEQWQFTGTTPDKTFTYGTGTAGGGLLLGVDFPLSPQWSLGLVARAFAMGGPKGTRTSCGMNCDGEVPGGSENLHSFVDLGARVRWSLPR